MRIKTTTAAIAASALVATACGAGGSDGPDAAAVPDAMVAAMADSIRLNLSMDAAIDLLEITEISAQFPEFEDADDLPSAQDEEDLATFLRVVEAASLTIAVGEDGLSQAFSFDVDGKPLAEFRVGGDEAAQNMDLGAIAEAGPVDATFLLRLDEDVLRDFVDLLGEELPFDSLASEIEGFLGDPSFQLPDEIADVVRAFANGEWAGIGGELDLGSYLESFGMDASMMEDLAPSTDVPTPEDFARIVADGVTFERVDDVDGEAVYVGDVDTDTLLRGFADLFASFDTTGQFEAMQDELPDDLPVIDDLIRVTFDGDKMTSLRFDLMAVIAEAAIAEEELEAARADEFRAAVDGMTKTTMDLVMTFTDHGSVGDLVAEVDATTASWQSVVDLIGGFFAAQFSGGGGFGSLDSADDEQAQADLRNAAVAQEVFFTENSTYTLSLADLEATGFVATGAFTIVRADDTSHCMEAQVGSSSVWSYDSDFGQTFPGPCF